MAPTNSNPAIFIDHNFSGRYPAGVPDKEGAWFDDRWILSAKGRVFI